MGSIRSHEMKIMPTHLMKLSQSILQGTESISNSEDLIIGRVVLGVRYSGIKLRNGITGVSFTYTNPKVDHEAHHQLLQDGFLSDKTLVELIDYCSSKYGILRTIGVTALNTYSQAHIDYSSATNQDIGPILKAKKGDLVGMVGNVKPLSRYLSKKSISMRILDEFAPPRPSHHITSINSVSELEGVDHLLVSGSALVFDNFDDIIGLLPQIKGKKILVGPSAQIIPEYAFELGFSAVGSSQIINPDQTLKVIQEGGGYFFYRNYSRKYAFVNPKVAQK